MKRKISNHNDKIIVNLPYITEATIKSKSVSAKSIETAIHKLLTECG